MDPAAKKGTPGRPYRIAVAGAPSVGVADWIARVAHSPVLVPQIPIRCATSHGVVSVTLHHVDYDCDVLNTVIAIVGEYDYALIVYGKTNSSLDFARTVTSQLDPESSMHDIAPIAGGSTEAQDVLPLRYALQCIEPGLSLKGVLRASGSLTKPARSRPGAPLAGAQLADA